MLMTTHVKAALALMAAMSLPMQTRADLPTAQLSLARVLTLAELSPAPAVTAPTTATGVPTPPEAASNEDAPDYGLTGNWAGLRDQWAQHHLYLGGHADLEISKVLRGGLDTRAWPTSYLLDINLTADIGKEFGHGGILYLDFQSHDQSPSAGTTVGDIQGFDTIGAPRFVQIAQLWYKQTIAGTWRIKVGKIDMNADAAAPGDDASDGFSLIPHGLEFLNTATEYSPSIFAATSYPSFGPGAEIFAGKDAYLGAGTFYSNFHQTFLNIAGHPETVQASAGGMFSIVEAGTRWASVGDSDQRPGHAAFGAWYHSGVFPRNDGGTNRGAGGGYAFLDQSFFREGQEGKNLRDIGGFFSAAISDRDTSPMDENLALGLTATGFVPSRPDDCCGICASWVHLPSPGFNHPYELATEIFYKIQLTPWASLKPDFQYIVSPGGVQRDAAVVTIRAEIEF
jgi:porin